MREYHVRFCERFRGEIPLYLLDVCPALLGDTRYDKFIDKTSNITVIEMRGYNY